MASPAFPDLPGHCPAATQTEGSLQQRKPTAAATAIGAAIYTIGHTQNSSTQHNSKPTTLDKRARIRMSLQRQAQLNMELINASFYNCGFTSPKTIKKLLDQGADPNVPMNPSTHRDNLMALVLGLPQVSDEIKCHFLRKLDPAIYQPHQLEHIFNLCRRHTSTPAPTAIFLEKVKHVPGLNLSEI